MNTFRVWVKPGDYSYLLIVDGSDNALWLLERLGHAFVFRSAQPIAYDRDSALCTFQLPRNQSLSPQRLRKLLSEMPEVILLQIASAS